jgi:hypothetical protein
MRGILGTATVTISVAMNNTPHRVWGTGSEVRIPHEELYENARTVRRGSQSEGFVVECAAT